MNLFLPFLLVTIAVMEDTAAQTRKPSRKPTTKPTRKPTTKPTRKPTTRPTRKPATKPTKKPTMKPTMEPTTTQTCENGLEPSPLCVEGFTCLQNCDYENEDSMFKIDISLELINTYAQDAFARARTRWMNVIVGDRPPIYGSQITTECKNKLPTVLDDFFICGKDTYIDGPGKILGAAGPEWWWDDRPFGKVTPISGKMVFDTSDIEILIRDGSLEGVILHEMGHVIGVGTVWGVNSLLDQFNNYRDYTTASTLWKYVWGCVGTPPVEKDYGPGTAFGHWDEECLGEELMTGFMDIAAPFSTLTIASLEDIGYTVDYNTADFFDGSGTTCCVTGAPSITVSHTPALSGEGIAAATSYGQNILNENKRPDDDDSDRGLLTSGLKYVGDREIVVFYEENGLIHEVLVKSS